MNNVTKYNGKNVLVMGFGLSGLNAAHLLVKLGANVVANDQKTPDDPTIVENLKKKMVLK